MPEGQVVERMPVLKSNIDRVQLLFITNSSARMAAQRKKEGKNSQFKSPGQGARGQLGRQSFHPGQGYNYSQGGYAGLSGHNVERRMSSAGSEGDSFLQGPGDESYDYQHLASDDSRDTQQGAGEFGHAQSGFHGAFGNGSSQQGLEGHSEQQHQSGSSGPQSGETTGGGTTGQSPPDIKVEVTPYPFMKTNDFELIEIDPDDEDDI